MTRSLLLALAGAVGVAGAALAFDRVFIDDAWRGPALLAIALPTALAAALRAVRVPVAVRAVISGLGMFLAAYVLFIDSGPLLPGPDQVTAVFRLALDGTGMLYNGLAPVNAEDGLVLLVFAGTWLVSHATHEVVTETTVGAIGLALPAALWTVPVAIPVPEPRIITHTVPFLLGAVVYLLFTSDQDVVGWASDRRGPRASPAGMALGGVAVITAVAIPLAAFGYGAEAWLELSGGSNPRGYQPIVDVGDRLKLPTPRDVLRVEAEQPSYLRIAALETFDGTSWRVGPPSQRSFRPRTDELFDATDALPPEVPITGTRVDFSVDVEVLELENIYVPVPYQPVRLSGPDADTMVYSLVGGFVATANLTEPGPGTELTVGVTPGVRYVVDASTPLPTHEELAGAEWSDDDRAGNVELPDEYPQLAAVAEQVWVEAGATSTVDRVLALQDWFIGPDSEFRYSTDVPDLRGETALQRFVLDTRVGYCEYFATAMAVMLRTANIPTRVSVGFLPGTPSGAAGAADRTWTVSTEDAHAWVEVLFPEVGWVKFDPTPRSDGATYVPTAGNLTPRQTQAELGELGVIDPIAPPTQGPSTPGDGPTTSPTDSRNFGDELDPLPVDVGGGGLPLWSLVLLGLAMAFLAIVVYVRWTERRPNATDPIGRVVVAQGRMHDEARRLGVPRDQAETIHETAARLAHDGRGSPDTLWRLADLSTAAAFGRRASEDDASEAEGLSRVAIGELRTTATRADRTLGPVRQPLELIGRGWAAAWTRAWQAWARARGR